MVRIQDGPSALVVAGVALAVGGAALFGIIAHGCKALILRRTQPLVSCRLLAGMVDANGMACRLIARRGAAKLIGEDRGDHARLGYGEGHAGVPT